MRSFKDSLEFDIEVKWDGETGGTINCNEFEFYIDMPKDFEGNGRYPCPDQLFLSSIGGCILTTLLHFSKRFQASIDDIGVSLKGCLALDKKGGYRISLIEGEIAVFAQEDSVEIAERCAELAVEYCHITKSIEGVIPIHIDVSAQIVNRSIDA